METNLTPTLYLRLRRRVRMRAGQPIRLGDIAQLIAEPEEERRIRELEIAFPERKEGNYVVIDMLRIVRKVKAHYPRMTIEQYGEPQVLVELVGGARKPPNTALVILMCLLLFIGSGLAIMNFHEDVSMLEVHQRIYELVTGTRSEHPYILQIPYSIGLGAGMVIFFNHLFKKKFNEEPSPLEVEMFLYQENLNQYVIAEEFEQMHKRRDHP